jgi:hypothetical protein
LTLVIFRPFKPDLYSGSDAQAEFAVAFDSSTAKRLEDIAQENAGEAGTDRRLALAVLSKSFSELQQAVAVAPHAASNSYEQRNLVSDGAPAV